MNTSRRHHAGRSALGLAGLTGVALSLYLGAGVGMAYVAGFGAVRRALGPVDWPWLLAMLAGVVVSFGGYYLGYRGAARVESGPDLGTRPRLALVTAGFGGFLVHGGAALDDVAIRAAGASEREGRVRAALIAALEHGILAIPCSAAAIALLAAGVRKPPLDFTLPWAVLPGIGFIVGLWAAERYRERLRDRGGWRGRLSIALDAAHLVGAMLRHPGRYWSGVGGMLLFWLADMFALWAAMAAFGFHMNPGAVVVALGTAMIVTRRTGPLGGAGILGVALPPTLWYSGAPWPQAVLGTFSYRFFMLWLPLPFAFLALPRMRALVRGSQEGLRTAADEEEPALQR